MKYETGKGARGKIRRGQGRGLVEKADMLLSTSWVGCGTSSAGKKGDGAALFGQGDGTWKIRMHLS